MDWCFRRLMPAGAGTPRCGRSCGWYSEFGADCQPQRYISLDHSAIDGKFVSPIRQRSGTCFRTNRSCRLVPAHQGVKRRSCDFAIDHWFTIRHGLVQRNGTTDSATPLPDPSGGQAPALHFLIAPTTIGQQLGTFRWWRTGIVIESRAHSRDNGRTRQVLLRLNNNARQTT